MSDSRLQYPDAAFIGAQEELYREQYMRSTCVAVGVARELENGSQPEYQGIARILLILEGCGLPEIITSGERQGATVEQLTGIANRACLGDQERKKWREVAASIPLSVSHASFIGTRLDQIAELEAVWHLEAR